MAALFSSTAMPATRTRTRTAAPARQPRAKRPTARAPQRPPRVGFISLGCPKALVDSERILTQLRAEGYETAPSYEAADLVVVNTCGFIDAAVDESLDTIGEALAHNGRVIVTGCLGAKPERILARHPSVLRSPARRPTKKWWQPCTRTCRRSTTRSSTCCRRRACG
jgi:tRNA A37 methylthiotransferase MiaB